MAASLTFRSAATSDVGKKRTLNEDAVLARPEIGLWAVADGMGGHGGGDIASRALVDALGRLPPPPSASALLDEFEARVGAVNGALRELARREGRPVIGATLAALLIYGAHFACVWCGDSRVYRLRDGVLEQLSHDHSEVQDLVDRGVLDKAEAKSWPRGNIVTRAIGASDQAELEIVDGPVASSDRFLICSDGLTAHVEDDEIAAHLAGADPRSICDALIALTLQRGAADNVSVVVVVCDDREVTVLTPGALLRDPS
jgi:serine/threonine protein phosphatase PrpC